MPCSGMCRRVVLVRTDVSEEHIASIIRVERIRELGTTSAVVRCGPNSVPIRKIFPTLENGYEPKVIRVWRRYVYANWPERFRCYLTLRLRVTHRKIAPLNVESRAEAWPQATSTWCDSWPVEVGTLTRFTVLSAKEVILKRGAGV
jgi:hypothetical protein